MIKNTIQDIINVLNFPNLAFLLKEVLHINLTIKKENKIIRIEFITNPNVIGKLFIEVLPLKAEIIDEKNQINDMILNNRRI